MDAFEKIAIGRGVAARRNPADGRHAKIHVHQIEPMQPGKHDCRRFKCNQSSAWPQHPKCLSQDSFAVADLESERDGVEIETCITDAGHALCVQDLKIEARSERNCAPTRNAQHRWTDIRDHNRSALEGLAALDHPQHDVAGAGGRVEHARPRLLGYQTRDPALPQPMNPEAEQIAKNVVASRDPSKYIVDTCVKRCGIGRRHDELLQYLRDYTSASYVISRP